MKIRLLFLFFSCCVSPIFGQDLVTKINGEEISGKVLEVAENKIRISTYDTAFAISKADVVMILYANGTKDIFLPGQLVTLAENKRKLAKKIYNDSLSILGKQDAAENFRKYKKARTYTFISTVAFPPAGLITAIATSSTSPALKNLDYPEPYLFSQAAYANSYKKKAHKMKAGQVWESFGLGCVFTVFASIFIYPTLFNQH